MPKQGDAGEMVKFNEELVKVAVVLAMEGSSPARRVKRRQVLGKERTVIDGAFAETKELIAGFWLWQLRSMERGGGVQTFGPQSLCVNSDIEIRQVIRSRRLRNGANPRASGSKRNVSEGWLKKIAEGVSISGPSRFDFLIEQLFKFE